MAVTASISSMHRDQKNGRVGVEVSISAPLMGDFKVTVVVQPRQLSEASEMARQAIATFAAELAKAVEHPGSLG